MLQKFDEQIDQKTTHDEIKSLVETKPAKRKYTKRAVSVRSNIDAQTPITPSLKIAHDEQSAQRNLDINSLRIPTNFGERFAVKKLLVNVPVKKPNKSSFVRVKDGDEWEFMAFVFENKEAGETYLLTSDIADVVSESVRAVRLHLAVDRRANPLLIPVPLPDESGRRNAWHDSLALAVERAKHRWVRIVANMPAGSYDLLEAQGELNQPVWPEQNMTQLVEIAFQGKIISNLAHPVIKELLGQA